MRRLGRNKRDDNFEWYLHPTKGWKKVWYGERMIREHVNKSILQRIRDKFSFDLSTNKPI